MSPSWSIGGDLDRDFGLEEGLLGGVIVTPGSATLQRSLYTLVECEYLRLVKKNFRTYCHSLLACCRLSSVVSNVSSHSLQSNSGARAAAGAWDSGSMVVLVLVLSWR